MSERLAAAKLWLTAPNGGDSPYLSSALFSCPIVLTDAVETVTADDRWRIYANPDFVSTAEIPVLAAHLEHVLWHLLRDHAGRSLSMHVGMADSSTWKTAADLTIVETLTASAREAVGLPTPHGLGLRVGLSAEEYYTLLGRRPPEPPGEPCGSSADGLRRPYEVEGDVESGLDLVRAEEVRRAVAIEFRDHCRVRGTRPGEWSRWVEEVLEPKVPWQQVLRSSVRRAVAWTQGNTDPTYRRLSRRQAASPRTILPGTHRPVPAVAIVVDTSGSMDDGLLAQALGEIDGVLNSLGGLVGVEVISCDAAIHTIDKVTSARRVHLGGGGGTDMRIGIDAALALRPRPEIVIVLTDGETPWPSAPPPRCAVIAALLHRGAPPRTPDWINVVEIAA